MSSLGVSDYIPGTKLLVYVAENGRSFEFECDGSMPVEVVQRSIESLCGVPPNDQLLLCLEKKLEANRPLSFYKLPQDDREVFLYNRPRLHADSPPPDPETIDLPNTIEPSLPSPSKNPHPLDDAPDPALKALPSYERQFRYHFQRGRVVYASTQMKFETCQRLVREQRVQERALVTARASMDQGYHIVHQNFTEFIKCYSQQHRSHSDILANLGKDIEKLRSCELHPALRTQTRKCLLDLVKEDNLRKWAENCANSHRQFEVKVSQLKSMFAELKKRVDDLCSDKVSNNIRNLELTIRDNEKYLNEQKSIMQSLSKDVDTVKKLMDDCLSSQLSVSLRPHDAVSALGPMYDVHEKSHLPKMQGCDRAMMKLLDLCKTKKNEMNFFVHNFMQRVVYVQSIIRDIRLQFPVFKEAMERQDDLFAELKLVRGIAPAYRACFAEVIRRKSSMKLYMGLAGQLAEKLASERETEVRKREEFLKVQSVYVPRDILASMGLFDSPKQCDVNVAPFDTDLLELDFADLDRYAPKCLAGIPLKTEKSSVQKVGLVTSQDSCDLSEAELNSAVTNEKGDSLELLDCESVNIAGTSKLEVENAWLKAELASAVALICSFSPEIGYESVDDSKLDSLLKSTAEKTAEALHLKDEYSKHLQSMLKMKQMQCTSYEKRIQELEQGLADQYLQGQKLSINRDASESSMSALKIDGEVQTHYLSSEPMDEASSCSASLEPKLKQFCGPLNKSREGVDENMADLSSNLNIPAVDLGCNSMDSSMLESNRDEHHQIGDQNAQEKLTTEIGLTFQNHKTAESGGSVTSLPCEPAVSSPDSKSKDGIILELQNALADKTNECSETELKLKTAMDEVNMLRRDIQVSRKLLDESQLPFKNGIVFRVNCWCFLYSHIGIPRVMNCAHLENCLHEAREEAHTNLCAADRRASEYTALRASALKMHTLFERFHNCVTSSVSVASFADSLRSLALSLVSSTSEDEDGGAADFRASIKVLADKVGFLSRQRTDLLERCTRTEAAHGILAKELEEKKELVKSLYTKLQLEKQANKEKISFDRIEVHELAAFVRNSRGHYEAINRNYSNYFLSTESVALFAEHLLARPTYIVGQIVHIERQIVRPLASSWSDHIGSDVGNRLSPGSGNPPNPYNLPIGCEYFVVTVAMLPDTIHSPAS